MSHSAVALWLSDHFLTPSESAPYTLTVIRLLLASTSVALAACATDQVSRAEHNELLASVRALRAENARLETRLDRMEAELKAKAPSPQRVEQRPTSSGSVSTTAPAPTEEVPALTVVKLRPKREAPPKIATEVEVVEPLPTVITNLSADDPAVEPDTTELAAIDQQYLSGVDALKTGNADGGIAQLKQFARDWPKHAKADNALFYAALGLMAAREYKDAEQLLEQEVQSYPAGDATIDSMLKLAECRARLNRQADARATWEKIIARYPGTTAATTAQARLASASQKE